MLCQVIQVIIPAMPFFQHLWSYTLHVSCNQHNFWGETTQKSSLEREHTFLLHCFYQLSGPVESDNLNWNLITETAVQFLQLFKEIPDLSQAFFSSTQIAEDRIWHLEHNAKFISLLEGQTDQAFVRSTNVW